MLSFRFSTTVAPLIALAASTPAAAQFIQPLPGQPGASGMVQPISDADRLAEQMRVLAGDANDINALASAGELSLSVGDLAGAASLFARADKVDPRNGRVKAGTARLLLREERPGEALRYFDQAAGYGVPVASFAADRGLAYDLVGQQERAQRDYRLALEAGASDETTRRYALSLGIAGRKDEALAALEPLLRRSDRGAWRARAFILAMNGDVSGAATIATTMMPAGMATGLKPFFARLPTLPAADRAFAVQFGEVRPTPQRLADAQLAPTLAPLAPEPRPVQVAAAVQVPAPVDRRSRDKRRGAPAAVATVAPGATAPVTTLPAPPAYAATATSLPTPVATAAPRGSAPTAVTMVPATRAVASMGRSPAAPSAAWLNRREHELLGRTAVASAIDPSPTRRIQPITRSGVLDAPVTPRVDRFPAAPSVPATQLAAAPPPAIPSIAPSPLPMTPARALASVAPSTLPATALPGPVPAPGFSPAMTGVAPATPPRTAIASAIPATTTNVPAAGAAPDVPAPSSVAPTAVATAVPYGPPAPSPAASTPPLGSPRPIASAQVSVASATTIVPTANTPPQTPPAQIAVASVASNPPPIETSPAASTPPPSQVSARAIARAEPSKPPVALRHAGDEILARIIANIAVPASELRGGAMGQAAPVVLAGADTARSGRIDRGRSIGSAASGGTADKPATVAGRHGKATDTADTPPIDPKKAAADRKAAAKALADKKAAAAKALADQQAADAKKAARAEPPRIWVQVAGGAHEGDLPKAWAAAKGKTPALGGKQGWTTPLRATNRVLTGPFKTDAEARAFVNQLAKQGVSAFTFTSDPGQKVSRLPTK